MAKFRKKPVVIEAEQFREGETLPFRDEHVCCFDGKRWYIDTLEGKMQVVPDDWIIRGVRGEFYPCKPDIFAATYEPVEYTLDTHDMSKPHCPACNDTGYVTEDTGAPDESGRFVEVAVECPECGVCYCGMAMKDHKSWGSCTTPRVMPRYEQYRPKTPEENMQITLTATDRYTMHRGVEMRIWEGTDESGQPLTALVHGLVRPGGWTEAPAGMIIVNGTSKPDVSALCEVPYRVAISTQTEPATA